MIIGLAEREHGEEETVRTRSRFDLSDGKKKTLTKLSQKKTHKNSHGKENQNSELEDKCQVTVGNMSFKLLSVRSQQANDQ